MVPCCVSASRVLTQIGTWGFWRPWVSFQRFLTTFPEINLHQGGSSAWGTRILIRRWADGSETTQHTLGFDLLNSFY